MVATTPTCARLLARHDPTFAVEMIEPPARARRRLGLGTADLEAVRSSSGGYKGAAARRGPRSRLASCTAERGPLPTGPHALGDYANAGKRESYNCTTLYAYS